MIIDDNWKIGKICEDLRSFEENSEFGEWNILFLIYFWGTFESADFINKYERLESRSKSKAFSFNFCKIGIWVEFLFWIVSINVKKT